MKPLTPAQQKLWDAGFVRAIRLSNKGSKSRLFWPAHERSLAKRALRKRAKK